MSPGAADANVHHIRAVANEADHCKETLPTASDHGVVMTLITREWMCLIAGEPKKTDVGSEFWDLPIVTEHSQGDTFLRVHDPVSDRSWPTDLFSECDKNGVGIVNWPTTQEQLSDLMRVLGCVRKCSLCQGIHQDGECAACGRKLTAIPIGG